MGYLGPEAMFLLSLSPEGRESLYELVEEALQLRNSGFSGEEIEEQLKEEISRLEGVSATPRMVRRIVVGDLSVPDLIND